MDSDSTDNLEVMDETVVLPKEGSPDQNDVEQKMQVDMSDEENDVLDGESEPLVEDPSTDVRSDIQDILDGDLEFKGSFSFNKTYDSPPNPALRVDDLGFIGLPLSTTQAKEIIAHSIQAPFGKGERTIVDRTVRDTWEIDASKLHFDNPAWSVFMDGVIQEVCHTLGAKCSASKLRCEPYKLLLYETGSHFLPHQDTEKSKGMFATVIVLLPSVFTGGAAHLSHGGALKVIDCSADSLYKTSVLCWYTDVTHEIKPITSGYRLAIAYNLIHARTDLKPVLPGDSVAALQLKHVLLSWIQEASPMPAKLVYLLQHKYSHASFKGSALKGADAHKAAILEAVAKPLGFRIGLANLQCRVSGSGDDDFGHHDDNVGMAEVWDRVMTIEHLVDLQDGHEIRKKVHYKGVDEDDEDNRNEFIPLDLRDIVESGPIDEQEYEGYQGNGAGSLDLYYRRSVLVIWPHTHDPEIEYGDDPLKAASLIASTRSEKPTKEESLLTKFLLRGAHDQRFGDKSLQGLCDAACRWHDLRLWLNAIESYDATTAIERITEARILGAVDIFGFEEIRPIIEKVLGSEPVNARRIDLLNAITGLDEELIDSGWIPAQRAAVIQSLKAPQKGEEKLLLDLARDAGGLNFFQESILPQVIAVASSSFSLSLANYLTAEKSNYDQHDALTISDMVTTLLSSAIAKENFFHQEQKMASARGSLYYQHFSTLQPLTPDLPFAYIKDCFLAENPQLVEVIIDTITNISEVSAEAVLECTKSVLMPLIPLMKTLNVTEFHDPVPGLSKLCQRAIQLYMKHAPYFSSTEELSAIIDAVAVCEEWDMIHSLILPKIKTMRVNEFLYRAFIQKLYLCGPQVKFSENSHLSVANIITDLVNDLFMRANYDTDRSAIIRFLDLCFDTRNAPLALKLCARIAPESVSTTHVSSVLMPLLPEIQAILTRWRISPTTEPFLSLYRRTLEIFVETFVGKKPRDAKGFNGTSCSCQYCKAAIAFLLHPMDSSATVRMERIGAPNRKHLEKELTASGASQVASWVMIPSTPQGLSITKRPEMLPPLKWKLNREKVISTLDAITNDDSVRSAIIGTNYQTLISCLNGTNTSQPVASSSRLNWGASLPPDQSESATADAGSNVAQASSSSSSSKPAARSPDKMNLRGQPPSKKPRYNTDVSTDVIDLCSD